MFILKDAVSINREGVWNRVDSKHPGYRSAEGSIAILRPGHFILHDEVFPFLLVGIKAYAEDYERLPLKLFCDLAKYGAELRGRERTR